MIIEASTSGKEVSFPQGRYLVSKTDLAGVITYANQTFVDISGYSTSELIGKPHNLVRHADMPSEAFADLWKTLGCGLPWTGLVKNRCKNGDFYWVKAFVAPLRRNSQVIGYLSVRTEPNRQEVRTAGELYRQVLIGKTPFPRIRLGITGRYSFTARLMGVLGLLVLLIGGGAVSILMTEELSANSRWIIALNSAAVLVSLAMARYLQVNIARPLSRFTEYFNQIAEGNLTNEVDISRRDETGLLFCQLGEMQVHLLAMLDEISSAAHAIEDRSENLMGQMSQVDIHSNTQGKEVKLISGATDALSLSVGEVAANADQTEKAALQVKVLITESCNRIEETMAIAQRVVDAMVRSEATTDELSAAVAQISTVSDVISAIAGQTNLLALNAAIEAARAGEYGRGFAVVADEVRTLAERTASSTQDIAQRVAEIQRVTAQSIDELATAKEEVAASIGALGSSDASLKEVAVASEEVVSLAQSITSATQEQAMASSNVANTVERISVLIRANLQVSKCANEASVELSDTSSRLKTLIDGFKLYQDKHSI